MKLCGDINYHKHVRIMLVQWFLINWGPQQSDPEERTPIWNGRGFSSEILNLTPKGDIWAWLTLFVTPKGDQSGRGLSKF